jgi:hypothetical protein
MAEEEVYNHVFTYDLKARVGLSKEGKPQIRRCSGFTRQVTEVTAGVFEECDSLRHKDGKAMSDRGLLVLQHSSVRRN